jgi:hypothetical protein
MSKKTRQEEAYEYVTSTFIKLLEQDKRISYEHKRSVLAFYEDMFAHGGVRDNMLQAFSNFLGEIDKRMDAARLAGLYEAREALELAIPAGSSWPQSIATQRFVLSIIDEQINVENTKEQTITVTEDTDLTEVGGGDEDDTPLL